MSGSVTDAGLLRDAAAATTSNPDINGIFAGLNVLLVTPTKSLMDLANGHIHIRSLISRGASVVDHVSSDQEVMPAVSLSSFSHFIVFGPAQSWKLNTVADLIGFTERETLTAGIKVVSSDWVGHSVRERCLVSDTLGFDALSLLIDDCTGTNSTR